MDVAITVNLSYPYAVASNGQRFLVAVDASPQQGSSEIRCRENTGSRRLVFGSTSDVKTVGDGWD